MINVDREGVIDGEVTILPRGGFLVKTADTIVQFGSPPETIKDTMLLDGNVPEIFVLGKKLFNWVKGISIAEIEFPIYYNYFIRQKKTYIICTKEQFEQMKVVLSESLFGPSNFDINTDYLEEGAHSVPDLKKEMDFFRQNRKLSDLVGFGIFNKGKYKN